MKHFLKLDRVTKKDEFTFDAEKDGEFVLAALNDAFDAFFASRAEEGARLQKDLLAKIAQLEKSAEQLRLWAFMGMDKTYRRAISMEKRIERMRTTSKPTKARKMDARFSSAEFHGDEVLASGTCPSPTGTSTSLRASA